MSKNYQFCNNCGKRGHTFNNCKQPITSIGVIGFHFNKDTNKYEYLLIRRKDTLGYVDFIRGKYNIYNEKHIMNIIDEMTNIEKQQLLMNDFDTLWSNLWSNEYGLKYRNEEKFSREKFNNLTLGITTTSKTYTLETLINNSKTNWEYPEWGFPKGRRNYNEKDLIAGIREFEEETGISKISINILQNVLPFEEVFTGSNYKSYKHNYFLAYIEGNPSLLHFQTSEVSKVEWCDYDTAITYIRDYNLEKKDVLLNVNNLLEEYRLIF